MDPIDREAFLADLFCPANLQQQRQAPTSASSARNTSSNSNPLQANLESPSTVTTSRPHASASASPSVAAPHFWDVEALNKMMRSNPPEGAVHDLSLATSNRSKAPSPPAIPNLRGSSDSSYFNYFGTFTAATNHALTQEPASSSAPTTCSSPVLQAPALELFIHIPSTLQHQQGPMAPFELTPNHHELSCDSIVTTNPISLSNTILIAPSQSMFDSKDPIPNFPAFPSQQQAFNNGLDPTPIETSSFYDTSPITSPESDHHAVFSLNMAELHQQTSSRSNHSLSPAAVVTDFTPSAVPSATSAHPEMVNRGLSTVAPFSFPSSATPGAPSNFAMTAGLIEQPTALLNDGILTSPTFPSTTHYNDYPTTMASGVFNPNNPEHLSDLSSLVQHRQRLFQRQQQQQQQPLQRRAYQQQQQQLEASCPSPPPPLPPSQLINNHTSALHIDSRNSTKQYSFMRPLNVNSFSQSIYYSPPITHSISTNGASFTPSSSSTNTTHHHLITSDTHTMTGATTRRLGRPPLDRMPPLSPTTATFSPSSSSSSSSSTSTTSSPTSVNSRTPSPGVSNSSRQVSPKRFYIVEPYQHSDQKVDRRSFNSRKQLRQLQAQEQAQAHEREKEHYDHPDHHPYRRRQSSSS